MFVKIPVQLRSSNDGARACTYLDDILAVDGARDGVCSASVCGPWHPVCPTPGSNGIRCVCMSLGHLHSNTVSVPVAPWTARHWCLLRWSSGFAPSSLLIFARLPGVSPWTHARRPGAPPTSALFRQYIGSANDEQNSRKRRAGTMMVTTTRRYKIL